MAATRRSEPSYLRDGRRNAGHESTDATEAARAVLEWGFAARPELRRIIAVTQTANVRSHRVLQRLGITPIDTYVEWDAPQTVFAVSRAMGSDT